MKKVFFEENKNISETTTGLPEEKHEETHKYFLLAGKLYETDNREGKMYVYV